VSYPEIEEADETLEATGNQVPYPSKTPNIQA
jgi:hypothetical protein